SPGNRSWNAFAAIAGRLRRASRANCGSSWRRSGRIATRAQAVSTAFEPWRLRSGPTGPPRKGAESVSCPMNGTAEPGRPEGSSAARWAKASLVSLALAALLLLDPRSAGRTLSQPATQEATVRIIIDASRQYQTIDGFGSTQRVWRDAHVAGPDLF